MKTLYRMSLACLLIFTVACSNTETGQTDGAPAATSSDSSLASILDEINSDKAVLLDVREQDEWDTKRFKMAVLIPMSKINGDEDSLADLDKTKKIYTHCAMGVRAGKVADSLREKGYDIVALKYTFEELEENGFERTDK